MYYFRSSMPKFFIKTYGCQMNERDSEQVAHSLLTRGYERVAHEVEADVVLLNTCSVRDMADQKALGKMGMLGRMAKERPHVVFGFLGCMAQARGESLLITWRNWLQKKRRARPGSPIPATAEWTIRVFRSSILLRNWPRNRRFAISNSRLGRRQLSFR